MQLLENFPFKLYVTFEAYSVFQLNNADLVFENFTQAKF